MPMMNSRLVLLILWSVSLTLMLPSPLILAQDASPRRSGEGNRASGRYGGSPCASSADVGFPEPRSKGVRHAAFEGYAKSRNRETGRRGTAIYEAIP